MKSSPTVKDILDAVDAGWYAATHAKQTRRRLGRRKTAKRRRALEDAKAKCERAAVPLRSYIGMSTWAGHGIALEQELSMKNTMTALRYERRQIGKML